MSRLLRICSGRLLALLAVLLPALAGARGGASMAEEAEVREAPALSAPAQPRPMPAAIVVAAAAADVPPAPTRQTPSRSCAVARPSAPTTAPALLLGSARGPRAP